MPGMDLRPRLMIAPAVSNDCVCFQVDIENELGERVMSGVGALVDLKIDSVVAAAPDQYSMEMWKEALAPVSSAQMKYRVRTKAPVEELPQSEEVADDGEGEGEGEGEAAAEPELETAEAELVLSEWMDCYIVLYKTALMLFNRKVSEK